MFTKKKEIARLSKQNNALKEENESLKSLLQCRRSSAEEKETLKAEVSRLTRLLFELEDKSKDNEKLKKMLVKIYDAEIKDLSIKRYALQTLMFPSYSIYLFDLVEFKTNKAYEKVIMQIAYSTQIETLEDAQRIKKELKNANKNSSKPKPIQPMEIPKRKPEELEV